MIGWQREGCKLNLSLSHHCFSSSYLLRKFFNFTVLGNTRIFSIDKTRELPPTSAIVHCINHQLQLEKEMATHSSILAWKIPWTEKPGRLIIHLVTIFNSGMTIQSVIEGGTCLNLQEKELPILQEPCKATLPWVVLWKNRKSRITSAILFP